MTDFLVDYRRETGVHNFETAAGLPVHVVSGNSWEEFSDLAHSLAPDTEGVILTPELMTSPYHLDELDGRIGEVFDRTIAMQALSARFPRSLLLLGTATPNVSLTRPVALGAETDQARPHNSLVGIQNVARVGKIHKQKLSGDTRYFEVGQPVSVAAFLPEGVEALICSDLPSTIVYAEFTNPAIPVGTFQPQRKLDPATHTLLASTCWAIPAFFDSNKETDEDRFRGLLEQVIAGIFERYEQIRDVVVADRKVEGLVNTVGPFNAHFTRK